MATATIRKNLILDTDEWEFVYNGKVFYRGKEQMPPIKEWLDFYERELKDCDKIIFTGDVYYKGEIVDIEKLIDAAKKIGVKIKNEYDS